MITLTTTEVYNQLDSIFENENEFIHEAEYTLVHTAGNFNKEYCEKNNIPYFILDRIGGTIVVSKGDIEYTCISKDCLNGKIQTIIDKTINTIKAHNIAVEFNGNDILVNDMKCIALMNTTMANGLNYCAIHFSMNVDLDAIKNICLKPMLKIPKGLNDYGITREEIYKIFQD